MADRGVGGVGVASCWAADVVAMGKKKGGGKRQPQAQQQKKKAANPSRAFNFAANAKPSNQAKAPPPQQQKVEVNVSIASEAALRATISELSEQSRDDGGGSIRNAGNKFSASKLKESLCGIYDELIHLGFSLAQVEESLTRTAVDADVSREDVLDWLCLHHSADELPRKLASGAYSHKSAGTVTVLTRGDPTAQSRRAQEPEPKPKAAPKPSDPAADVAPSGEAGRGPGGANASGTDTAEPSGPSGGSKVGSKPKGKMQEDAKNWIKNYMETAYEDSSEDEDALMRDPYYSGGLGVEQGKGGEEGRGRWRGLCICETLWDDGHNT